MQHLLLFSYREKRSCVHVWFNSRRQVDRQSDTQAGKQTGNLKQRFKGNVQCFLDFAIFLSYVQLSKLRAHDGKIRIDFHHMFI